MPSFVYIRQVFDAEMFLQAVGVLKTLHAVDYHVTLVATDTYNTFTPLLPCTYLQNAAPDFKIV
jgi:hypothetical protein